MYVYARAHVVTTDDAAIAAGATVAAAAAAAAAAVVASVGAVNAANAAAAAAANVSAAAAASVVTASVGVDVVAAVGAIVVVVVVPRGVGPGSLTTGGASALRATPAPAGYASSFAADFGKMLLKLSLTSALSSVAVEDPAVSPPLGSKTAIMDVATSVNQC